MSEDENIAPEEVPDGMVRKRRRVRKKRRSSESSKERERDANSLFGKAKELLIGMHDEDEDYGPVDVAEQVRRLKKRNDDSEKPLDDVWGTKKRSASWLWIVLIGIIVPVVAIIIGITMLTDDGGQDTGLVDEGDMAKVKEKVFDPGEGPLGWYQGDSIGVIDEVKRIIESINEATTPDSVESLVRRSPYRKVNPINLDDWGAACLTNSLSGFRWKGNVVSTPGLENQTETGYLIVWGTRSNKAPFRAYFVYEEGRVVLDWEATTIWSEGEVEELAESQPRKETLVRCLLEKRPVYDLDVGEEGEEVTYTGYFISSHDKKARIIAYVPLDSERNKQMDRELKAVLNYGSFITNQPMLKNQRVTLKVRHNSDIGSSGIFEIAEFEQAEWIRP